MIPSADVTPRIPAVAPTCTLPSSEEISEDEGFGFFRDTWFIGRVPVAEAEEIVREEEEILEWLDSSTTTADEFEVLALAIENQDADEVADALGRERPPGLDRYVSEGDMSPLGGLEIGVAGLCHVLSAVGCLTAASCRSHSRERSWSDVPVVLFRAPTWRVELLLEPLAQETCGLGEDRGMLTIYAPSVRHLHALAQRLLRERARFRRMPDARRPAASRSVPSDQLQLPLDAS